MMAGNVAYLVALLLNRRWIATANRGASHDALRAQDFAVLLQNTGRRKDALTQVRRERAEIWRMSLDVVVEYFGYRWLHTLAEF